MAIELPTLRTERCETCRFWEKDWEISESELEGYCHRGLRHVTREDTFRGERASRDGLFWSWPIHHAEDWCGEWQAQPGGASS